MTLYPFIKATGQRFIGLSFLTVLVLFAGPLSVQAQDDDTLRTDTTVVQLNVGVVNKQGRAITTLSRNDFSVFEDGVKQSIQNFDPTEAPFSLVMLMDMSGSTVNFRQQVQTSAIRFLDALKPDDRVAVIQFNGKGVKSLLGFSTDHNRIAYAISNASGAGSTPFYDALKFSLKELAKEGGRRKAIVVLTDGIDTDVRRADTEDVSRVKSEADIATAIKPETNPALNAVLNGAARQGVTIFPLALPSGDPKRLPLPDPLITAKYVAARTRMQMLADRTGGALNEISSLDQMAKIYVEVAANLRRLYTVTYQSSVVHPRDGKWHEIRVEVIQPELVARTRPGYFAK
jgi:Ca-activated chloride channel family protein